MGTCSNALGGWCDDAECVRNGCKLAPAPLSADELRKQFIEYLCNGSATLAIHEWDKQAAKIVELEQALARTEAHWRQELEAYRSAAEPRGRQAGEWIVAPGDPTHVFVPGLVKLINCYSKTRAAQIVAAMNGAAGEPKAARNLTMSQSFENHLANRVIDALAWFVAQLPQKVDLQWLNYHSDALHGAADRLAGETTGYLWCDCDNGRCNHVDGGLPRNGGGCRRESTDKGAASDCYCKINADGRIAETCHHCRAAPNTTTAQVQK